MMRQALLPLLLLPGISFAVVCKTVDPDGTITYTDVPASACPEPVEIRPSSTYTPRPIEQPETAELQSEDEGREVFEGYRSIKIVQPEANGSVRSNEGVVPVSIALEPALQKGHRVDVYVDGNPVEGSFDGLAIELSGVERGTHSLRVRVVDTEGKTLIESASIAFTLRKTGLFDGAARPVPTPRVPPAR